MSADSDSACRGAVVYKSLSVVKLDKVLQIQSELRPSKRFLFSQLKLMKQDFSSLIA